MKNKIKTKIRISKKFPFINIKKSHQASLVLVENLDQHCLTDAERLLYHQLRAHMYYPTPQYNVQGVRVNLALVPYKLALVEYKPNLNEKKLIRQLKKRKWRVIFYNPEHLLIDAQPYVNLIFQHAPRQTKNASSS